MKTRSNSEHRYYIVEIHITLEWSGLKCNPCKSTQTSFDKYILSATTGTAVRESCLMRTAHHYYFSCIVTKTKNTQAVSLLKRRAKQGLHYSFQCQIWRHFFFCWQCWRNNRISYYYYHYAQVHLHKRCHHRGIISYATVRIGSSYACMEEKKNNIGQFISETSCQRLLLH